MHYFDVIFLRHVISSIGPNISDCDTYIKFQVYTIKVCTSDLANTGLVDWPLWYNIISVRTGVKSDKTK